MVKLELSMNIRSNQDYLWLILVVLVMKAIFKVIRVVGIFGVVVSIYLLLVYVPDILNRISDHIDIIARVRPDRARAYFDGFITQRRLVPDNRCSILLSSTSLSDLALRNRIASTCSSRNV